MSSGALHSERSCFHDRLWSWQSKLRLRRTNHHWLHKLRHKGVWQVNLRSCSGGSIQELPPLPRYFVELGQVLLPLRTCQDNNLGLSPSQAFFLTMGASCPSSSPSTSSYIFSAASLTAITSVKVGRLPTIPSAPDAFFNSTWLPSLFLTRKNGSFQYIIGIFGIFRDSEV